MQRMQQKCDQSSNAEAKPEKGRSLTEDTMVCTTLQTDSSNAWELKLCKQRQQSQNVVKSGSVQCD